MSVPVGARGENLTTVFTLSADLLALCIHAAMNTRHFPAKFTRELGEPFVAAARRAMHAIYAANRETRPEARGAHVSEALKALDILQAELHLNFLHFSLKAPKAGEISDRITELRSKFIAWSKAVR